MFFTRWTCRIAKSSSYWARVFLYRLPLHGESAVHRTKVLSCLACASFWSPHCKRTEWTHCWDTRPSTVVFAHRKGILIVEAAVWGEVTWPCAWCRVTVMTIPSWPIMGYTVEWYPNQRPTNATIIVSSCQWTSDSWYLRTYIINSFDSQTFSGNPGSPFQGIAMTPGLQPHWWKRVALWDSLPPPMVTVDTSSQYVCFVNHFRKGSMRCIQRRLVAWRPSWLTAGECQGLGPEYIFRQVARLTLHATVCA